VAHHAGGVVVTPAPSPAPSACGTTTGFAGAESHIVATTDAVIFTPAVQPSGTAGTGSAPVPFDENTQSNGSPAGLAVTSDGGSSWSLAHPSGLTWNPTDHGDFVDPVTNRVFFEDYGPIPLAPELGATQEGPAHIMWTDTPGSDTSWHHTAIPNLFLPENPRFTAAPAPAGGPAPADGYPNVVYFCANTNVGFVAPVIAGRLCFKSLDGGDSFTQTGVLFTGTVPQHAECSGGEVYSAIDGYYPQPASDGSLFVMVACGGTTYLARSTDEAASFPVVHRGDGSAVTLPVPPASTGDIGGPDLRIGSDGTMYVAWAAPVDGNSHVFLIVSGDNGLTWSAPMDVTAPQVSAVDEWALAQRGDVVAVAYLGHTGTSPALDGYITATKDASAVLTGGDPLFWSARVNAADRPLLYGSGVQGSGFLPITDDVRVPYPPPFGNQMFGNDFIGATVAPDGSVWGSFDQDCGPDADSVDCPAQNDQTRGFAGHLVWGA
jgi:hypothetical protein